VRDVYFEPALGHRSEDTVRSIVRCAHLGRPALVEMHRFNFVDDFEKARSSFAELTRLLALSLRALPGLRFVAPRELARAIEHRDADLLETRISGRLAVWLRRLWEERRVRWLALATGAIVPMTLVWFWASLVSGRLPRKAHA
jgi:hypothetical protein